jgi:hypothetical protein
MKNNLVILLLAVYVFLPVPGAHALDADEVPPLAQFVIELTNGDPDELRGIHVPGVMAYEIVPQPEGRPAFVTLENDALTLFELASRYETTGLLAHNYLAGDDFFLLEKRQLVHLIYGDGRTETYVIRHFWQYQALSPKSVTSNFVDLDTGEQLTASQLFLKVYNRPGDLVLQTCIYRDGESSWGRLFIIAEPFVELEPQSMPGYMSFQ